jgi:ABC-type glycerol-3-phosphate transport system substrate-binding protein
MKGVMKMNKILKQACSISLIGALVFSMVACKKTKPDWGSRWPKESKVRLWSKPNSDARPQELAAYEESMKVLKEKFPNVEFIEESLIPAPITDSLMIRRLMAGIAPTSVGIFSYTDIPTRSKNNTIADISKYVDNWDLKKQDKIITQFDDAIKTKEGKWYAIPRQAYVIGTLYNSKAIKDGGGDPENYQRHGMIL